jgi:hypothetical protein
MQEWVEDLYIHPEVSECSQWYLFLNMHPMVSGSQSSPRRATILDELVIYLAMPLSYAVLINFEKTVLINYKHTSLTV